MNFTSSRRLLIVGLALIGSAGTGAAVAHAVTGPDSAQQVATAPQVTTTQQVAGGRAPAATAPARVTPAAAGPVTPTQAKTIAERQGQGRATKVEAETDSAGTTYDVDVIRPGGVEVKVVVAADTGRVLRTEVDTEAQDETDAPDSPDAADTAEPGQDNSDN